MITLLWALGCTGDTPRFDVGGADTGGDAAQTYMCGGWAPWVVGRTFTFHARGTDWESDRTRTISVMDEDGTVERALAVDDVYFPGAGIERGHCDDTGYVLDELEYAQEGYSYVNTYHPGALWIPRPQPLGAAWVSAYTIEWVDGDGSSGSTEDSYTSTVVNVETVSLPIGVVRAFRVEVRGTDDDTLWSDLWYAEGLGQVQSINYDGDMNPTQQFQLVSIQDGP